MTVMIPALVVVIAIAGAVLFGRWMFSDPDDWRQ